MTWGNLCDGSRYRWGLLFAMMIWERKDGGIVECERQGTLMLAVVGVMLVGGASERSFTLLVFGFGVGF